MFDIYLFRHGDAEKRARGGSDEVRVLTTRGKVEVRQVAEGLLALGVGLDVILTSPLLRARETGAIAGEVLRPPSGARVCDELAPGGAHEALFREIARLDLPRLMLVGHAPDLGELASVFVWGSPDGAVAIKKAGVIRIVAAELPPAARGELRWLLTAGQLSRIASAPVADRR
jgi:phosphohistidine phosphatase